MCPTDILSKENDGKIKQLVVKIDLGNSLDSATQDEKRSFLSKLDSRYCKILTNDGYLSLQVSTDATLGNSLAIREQPNQIDTVNQRVTPLQMMDSRVSMT
jgi:hypothetical protein